MIDLRRRSFLFGAGVGALLVPARKLYLLPAVREVELAEGHEFDGSYWARRTVDVAGTEWNAFARFTPMALDGHADAARLVREAVLRVPVPKPAWKV